MASYKDEHQRFMSGHTGTSFDQLVFVLGSAFVTSALRDAVLVWIDVLQRHRSLRFITDFSILVVSSLLNLTLLSSNLSTVFICLVLSTCFLFFTFIHIHRPKSLPSNLHNTNLDERKFFVTYFRSIVSVMTALSILAVDFKVFPRRFAKTEEFGYGMMDYGVGLFVVANGIVSPEARGKNSLPRMMQIKKAFVSSLPLLILGIGRLVSVKGTDYHEHVTEYGVHWNFFFTLAALKISSTFVFCIVPNMNPGISGLVVLFGHQLLLLNGLSSYIISGADGKGGRTSLIDANREGIFSLPGYVALYMMSVQLGQFIFQKRTNLWDWLKAALCLFGAVVGMACCMYGLNSNVQFVSRRFTNASYVFCTMSFTCLALTICLLGDIAKTYCIPPGPAFPLQQEKSSPNSALTSSTSKNQSATDDNDKLSFDKNEKLDKNESSVLKNSCLLEAISFNGLLFFLQANVMTGFVNMSMSTIYANTATSMLVLGAYSFLLCFTSLVMYSKGIKSKIW